MPWRHGLGIVEDVATLVRSLLGMPGIFGGASGSPPVDILTTALTSCTGMGMDPSTLEPELSVSPSLNSVLVQINHPPSQDKDPPTQGLTVIHDGESERPDTSTSYGTDPLAVPDHAYEQITGDQSCVNPINTLSSPVEGYVTILRPDSPFVDDWQCVNATNVPAFPTQDHISPLSPTPFRVLAPPDKLHSTLTSLLRNTKKLSHLLDRVQKLASSAPAEQQSRQMVTLRATFKEQQVRFIEFLRLSEEFAGRYLRDIPTEIQRQTSYLAMLKKRSDTAKILLRQIVDLRRTYKSGTIAAMRDVRAKGKEVSSHMPS